MKYTEETLRTKIQAKIREELEAQGLNPDIRPKHQWLRDNGYGGIEGFARRNDMTASEVLIEICGFDDRDRKSLGINHTETLRVVEEWFNCENEVAYQWGVNRVSDARTHIRVIAQITREKLGMTNLLKLVRGDAETATNMLFQIFSGLAQRLETQGAQSNYTRTLARFAKYVCVREGIPPEKNHIKRVRNFMGYSYERKSPEHGLSPTQLYKCWEQAEQIEDDIERLKVKTVLVLLAGSGVRRGEVVLLTTEHLRLDRDDPYIVFGEERKSGPGLTSIMAGVEIIESWIEYLESCDDWDGKWLFPSTQSGTAYRDESFVNDVIDDLVNKAGIEFADGEKPTPKDFRSFWYELYYEARDTYLSHLEYLADEQGVSSAEVIDKHYMRDKHARDHFRKFAQAYFEEAFGSDHLHGINEVRKHREEDEEAQLVLNEFVEE